MSAQELIKHSLQFFEDLVKWRQGVNLLLKVLFPVGYCSIGSLPFGIGITFYLTRKRMFADSTAE